MNFDEILQTDGTWTRMRSRFIRFSGIQIQIFFSLSLPEVWLFPQCESRFIIFFVIHIHKSFLLLNPKSSDLHLGGSCIFLDLLYSNALKGTHVLAYILIHQVKSDFKAQHPMSQRALQAHTHQGFTPAAC